MPIYYDNSIVKKTKDGNTVIATTLEKGETLIDGSTYRDEEVRLRDVNSPSPFAQSSMTEWNNPENPAPGLTTEDGINTIRVGDDITLTGEQGEETPSDLKATVSDDGNSTIVVPTEGNEAPLSAAESGAVQTPKGDKEYLDPPKESDSKREWFDYAVAKGHEGEYGDITKNELVAQYGN